MAQSNSNNGQGARPGGGWFNFGLSRLSNIFGNGGQNTNRETSLRKRTINETLNESVNNLDATPSQPSPRALALSGPAKRLRKNSDTITEDPISNIRLNSSVLESSEAMQQHNLNMSTRSLVDVSSRRPVLDFLSSSMTVTQRRPTRAKQILDILDKIETSTTALPDDALNFSKTQKWLEDINVIKATPPPRKSLRTPSRLSTIIASSRPKPAWQRAQSNQPPSEKPTETSFEEQEDPGNVSPSPPPQPSKSKATPYSAGVTGVNRGESRTLKGVSGKNVLRATDDVFEVDTNDLLTMEQLASVKPVAVAPPPSAYRTKPRSFNFALPVLRGPKAVIETVIEEQISADSALNSDEDVLSEESRVSTPDKIANGIKTPTSKLNSETSSSCTSDGDKTVTPPKAVVVAPAPVASSKWECPSCMTENTADACECCETPRPKPWCCDTCFVDNEASDAQCVACGSAPPGSAAGQSSAPAAPAFKPQDFTKKPAAGGAFKFGLSAAPAASTDAPKPSLPVFGLPEASTKPAAPITFGLKPAESTEFAKPAAPISFGLKPTESSAKPAETTATKPVTFGLAAPAAPSSSTETATTTSNLFGASATTTAAPASSGLFGSKLTPSLPLFGASATTTASTGSGLFGNAAVTTASSLFTTPVTATTNAPTSNLFGAPATTTTAASSGLFGATSSSSAPSLTNMFGAPTSTASVPSLFGASAATTTTNSALNTTSTATTAAPSLFGTSAAPASTTSLFGATPAVSQPALNFGAAQPSLFGASLPPPPATSNLFGATSNQLAPPASEAPKSNGFNFGAAPTNVSTFGALNGTAASAPNMFGGFGDNAANTEMSDAPPGKRPNMSFGNQPSTNLFGSAPSNAPAFNSNSATGFNFGSNGAPPASFAFGATPAAPNSSAFQFGASAAPAASQAPFQFSGVPNPAASFMPQQSAGSLAASNRKILSARRRRN